MTVFWKDQETDPIEFNVTAFGNAEGSDRMLVFYNDNISEVPVVIINEESILYVELSPLMVPGENTIETQTSDPEEAET